MVTPTGSATGLPGPARPAPGAGLRLDGVSLTFRGAGGTTHALDAVTLEVAPREVVALIGPNGCGKSTLLRVMAGLIAPDAGRVSVGETPVTGPDPRIGFVFQEPRLLPWLTAERNIRFPMQLAGWSEARQVARAHDLLGLVGLRDLARVRPSALSGGTRQRIAIARALALEPSVLLLDEPFSALDALTRERFNVELLGLWDRTGTTIVVVTHSIPEAVFVADRVAVLSPRPGRIVDVVPVDLPRPRRIADLDSAVVTGVAREIRAHLVDTTDDPIAFREQRTAVRAALEEADATGPRPGDTLGPPGIPAWFDPFRADDESEDDV
jgi:NitT/TauT family transport system ATP-binding protein